MSVLARLAARASGTASTGLRPRVPARFEGPQAMSDPDFEPSPKPAAPSTPFNSDDQESSRSHSGTEHAGPAEPPMRHERQQWTELPTAKDDGTGPCTPPALLAPVNPTPTNLPDTDGPQSTQLWPAAEPEPEPLDRTVTPAQPAATFIQTPESAQPSSRPPDALLVPESTTFTEHFTGAQANMPRESTSVSSASSSSSSLAPDTAQPEIFINIGRIDLRTAAPKPTARKQRQDRTMPTSLSDYLKGKTAS